MHIISLKLEKERCPHLMWEGAEKCLLRDLDRSEETCLFSFILMVTKLLCKNTIALSLEIKERKKASFPSRYNTAHRTSEIKLKSNEILLIASLSPGGSWALVKSPLVEVPWDHEGRQYLDIFFSL